jgi:integrase
VAAIGEALAQRRKPKSTKDAGIAFITWKGHRWQKIAVSEPDPKTGKIKMTNNAPVTGEFGKLLEALRLQQPGRGFYSLRHTFRTIADGCRDQAAANAIMGHVDESMAGAYRERIDDARLRAVVEHVHTWLFGSEGTK